MLLIWLLLWKSVGLCLQSQQRRERRKKCLFELAPVRLGPFLAVKTDTHPSTRIINCIDCANMAGLQHLWNIYKKFLCYSNDFHFSYSNSFLCVLVSYCIQWIPRTRSVFRLLFIFLTEHTVWTIKTNLRFARNEKPRKLKVVLQNFKA